MATERILPEATRELPLPGTRSGEGTQALWQHMARDELQKTSIQAGGQRDERTTQQPVHPGRRSTDRK